MRAIALFVTLGLPMAATAQPPAAEDAAPRVAIKSSLVLKVADRTKTADLLIVAAEDLDGYFTSRTDDQVVFKVPVAEVGRFSRKIESRGKVVERKYEARDVGAFLIEQRTLLGSRESSLKDYFKTLASADPRSVVRVETEMTNLVQQIETLKGSVRMVEHQLRYAEIVVAFQFRERRPPVRDGSSSFDWLNTVNLADLFVEFGHES